LVTITTLGEGARLNMSTESSFLFWTYLGFKVFPIVSFVFYSFDLADTIFEECGFD